MAEELRCTVLLFGNLRNYLPSGGWSSVFPPGITVKELRKHLSAAIQEKNAGFPGEAALCPAVIAIGDRVLGKRRGWRGVRRLRCFRRCAGDRGD